MNAKSLLLAASLFFVGVNAAQAQDRSEECFDRLASESMLAKTRMGIQLFSDKKTATLESFSHPVFLGVLPNTRFQSNIFVCKLNASTDQGDVVIEMEMGVPNYASPDSDPIVISAETTEEVLNVVVEERVGKMDQEETARFSSDSSYRAAVLSEIANSDPRITPDMRPLLLSKKTF